jgi:hypothetical protein
VTDSGIQNKLTYRYTDIAAYTRQQLDSEKYCTVQSRNRKAETERQEDRSAHCKNFVSTNQEYVYGGANRKE